VLKVIVKVMGASLLRVFGNFTGGSGETLARLKPEVVHVILVMFSVPASP
jgi:hypothetical protein